MIEWVNRSYSRDNINMDNLFQATGNAARRVVECLDDANQLFLNSVWDHSPGVYFAPDVTAKKHSDAIRDQIDLSLRHGDVTEAAQQMRRELYFCSTVDGLAGTKNELAARAGLKAIEKGLPPLVVVDAMNHATDDPNKEGYFTSEPDIIDLQLHEFQEQYKKDPDRFCHQRVKLRDQIKHAAEQNQPIDPNDRCKLAMFDLAFADLRVKTSDSPVLKKFVIEAKEMLAAAKKDGADTTRLDRIANRVSSHFELPQ